VSLAEDDDLVQTLAAEGPDESLDVRILPGTAWSADNFGDAHGGHATSERVAVDRVPVSDEPSRRGVLREGFNDLLGGPVCGRVFGDGEVDDSPALVREEHKDEEHAAGNVGAVKKSIETKVAM
jgi:hypothetical protein